MLRRLRLGVALGLVAALVALAFLLHGHVRSRPSPALSTAPLLGTGGPARS